MDKLKPCPFCGSANLKIDAKMQRRKYNVSATYSVSVRCIKCKARGSVVSIKSAERAGHDEAVENAKEGAIQKWNRRADNEQ